MKDFTELSPKDRAKLYCDLLQYGLPRLQAIQLETEFDSLSDAQLTQIIEELKSTIDG
jgi:predicted component of type VI protein secretion system